ncbi:MAG: hypothetical protein A2X49_13460 [Lentisphaerae bacterium GWF2_52_8]|nr:MAG: hypothetical protein A2X49_13460 [Lentisphaerae bacterium GWF2_52_8]
MGAIEEANIKKLTRSTLVASFVKRQKGEWDHSAWLGFCAMLEQKGYTPIDWDKVGLLLESKKAEYWGSQK